MTWQLGSSVVDWNGKLRLAIARIEEVEKLSVIISAYKQEYLLRVPKLSSSIGHDIASAVHKLLSEYHLLQSIQAFCCNTNAWNTRAE